MVLVIDLAAHAAALQQSGQLAPVLAEMSRADEAWAFSLKSRADSVVRDLHSALREGEPQSDDVADWVVQVEQSAGIGAVVESMCKGNAHWRRLVRHDPGVLVTAAFEGLLDRHPDSGELANYSNLLRDSGNLLSFLSEVGFSEEHRARILDRFGAAGDADSEKGSPSLADHESIITATFRGLLGRDPDGEAVEAYTKLLRETGDIAGFIAEVGRSAECRKRMLLKRA